MGSPGRRDVRYPYKVPVLVTAGRVSLNLFTEDVSFQGMYVGTVEPAKDRQLVRVQVQAPGASAPISLHAIVVRVVTAEDGTFQGMGLQLYGCGRGDLALWNAFVSRIRGEGGEEAPNAFVTAIRMREPEEPLVVAPAAMLDVRPRTKEQLQQLQTKNAARGGLFLKTELDLAPGTSVMLRLHHPETAEAFGLGCIVRRNVRERRLTGVAVDIVDWQGYDTFARFVEADPDCHEIDDADIMSSD